MTGRRAVAQQEDEWGVGDERSSLGQLDGMGSVTPLLLSNPVSGSKPNPGCQQHVMPPVGALIPLNCDL